MAKGLILHIESFLPPNQALLSLLLLQYVTCSIMGVISWLALLALSQCGAILLSLATYPAKAFYCIKYSFAPCPVELITVAAPLYWLHYAYYTQVQ